MFNPIKCGKCIAKIGMQIQGYDPRTWIKSCCWSCILRGKGAGAFKNCLEKKIKKEIHDIQHPEQVVNEIWDKIKHKCSD